MCGSRTRRGKSAMLIVGGCLAFSLSPARVQAGAASNGTWQGALILSVYPCPGVTCAGSFSGSLAGMAAGTDSAGRPFVVIWPDPTTPGLPLNLSATFQYSEACPLGATGSAGGTFTLSGGYVNDGGAVSHDGTMTGAFGWLRVGLTVVLQTSGGVLTGDGQTLATQQTIGDGGGAFAPTSLPSTCFSVQALTAQVAGSYGNPQ